MNRAVNAQSIQHSKRSSLRRGGTDVIYFTPAVPVSIGRLTNSRGSVMCPVRALAATVSGLARYTALLVLPIRPGKLRLVVLTHVSDPFSRPNVSAGPPRQAEHPLGPTR